MVNVDVEQLWRAKDEEREIPHADSGKPYRRAADEVSPRSRFKESSSSESEGGDPLSKITKRYRRERDSFSEEEDIPLAELEGRLKVRKRRLEVVQETADLCATSDDEMSVISDEAILVYGIMKKRKRKERRKKERKTKRKNNNNKKTDAPC